MSRAHGFSGLTWVSGELGVVIREARDTLERYVEDDGDSSALSTAIAHLSQVRGVLQMLHLTGAARLAQEMQASAAAMLESKVKTPQEAAEPLMLALILLPDYIEKLETTDSEDLPSLLLDTINDLRRSRGASILQESDLVLADLIQSMAAERITEAIAGNLQTLARQFRPRLHKGLLAWVKGPNPKEGIQLLGEVFGELAQHAKGAPLLSGILRAAQAVTVGMVEGTIPEDNHVKGLIGRVDRNVKELAEQGLQTAARGILPEQFQELLRLVAKAQSTNPLIKAVQVDYGLARIFPSEMALEEGQKWLTAPSANALSGVRLAAIKELLPIKDTLDLFMRGGRAQTYQLQDLAAPVQRLANTLEMVGLKDLSKRLYNRAADLRAIGSGELQAEDNLLMGIASDLLFVESSLDNAGSGSGGGELATDSAIPRGEMRNLVVRTLKEAALDMAKAKEAIISYIDSPTNMRPLETTPALFHGIAGALRVIAHGEAANLLDQVRKFIQQSLLTRNISPDQAILEALAETIAGIEYYMEAVADGRTDVANILDISARALQRLLEHSQPDPSSPTPNSRRSDSTSTPEVEHEDTQHLVNTDINSSLSTAVADPEILEIFLEEAREAEADIQQAFARWNDDHEDVESLSAVRRAFHTLKGSGRIAGAVEIGEFAWIVENLLNRVIDQTIPASLAIFVFLDQIIVALPELIQAQETGRKARINIIDFAKRADELLGKTPVSNSGSSITFNKLAAPVTEPTTSEAKPSSHNEAIVKSNQETSQTNDIWVESAFEDSELRGIFELESKQHLATIDNFLTSCQGKTAPYIFDEWLVRALHTLAGSAHMAQIGAIAVLAKALERKAVILIEKKLGADDKFLKILQDGKRAIQSIITVLAQHVDLPDTKELVAQVESYVEPKPIAKPFEFSFALPETTNSTNIEIFSELNSAFSTTEQAPEPNQFSEFYLNLSDQSDSDLNKDILAELDSIFITSEQIIQASKPLDFSLPVSQSNAATSTIDQDILTNIDSAFASINIDSEVKTTPLDFNFSFPNDIDATASIEHDISKQDSASIRALDFKVEPIDFSFSLNEPTEVTKPLDVNLDAANAEPLDFAFSLSEPSEISNKAEPLDFTFSLPEESATSEKAEPLDFSFSLPESSATSDKAEPLDFSFSLSETSAISDKAEPLDFSFSLPEPSTTSDKAEPLDFSFSLSETSAISDKSEPLDFSFSLSEPSAISDKSEPLDFSFSLPEPSAINDKAEPLDFSFSLSEQSAISNKSEPIDFSFSLSEPSAISDKAESLDFSFSLSEPSAISDKAEPLDFSFSLPEPSAISDKAEPLDFSFSLSEPSVTSDKAESIDFSFSLPEIHVNDNEKTKPATIAVEEFDPLDGDQELHEIFLEEAEELLEKLDATLKDWIALPKNVAFPREIKRILHTMKGGARLANIHAIGNISHALENLLDHLTPERSQFQPEVLTLAHRAAERLTIQINQVKTGGPVVRSSALIAEVEHTQGIITGKIVTAPAAPAIAPAPKAPTLASKVQVKEEFDPLDGDQELHEIFLEEAQELLVKLDTSLREWIATPQDASFPGQIKRILHTLKGGARLANIPAIGDLSHSLEMLLDRVTPEQLHNHPEILELAQRAADRLAEQVDQVKSGGPVVRSKGLIEEVEHTRNVLIGKAIPASPPTLPAPSSTTLSAIAPKVPAEPLAAPPATRFTPPLVAEEFEPLTGDQELHEIFLEEAQDLLGQLETRLREWIVATEDPSFPNQIKRVLHTLKGGARLAGVQAVGNLSHTLETLLDGLTPQRIKTFPDVLGLAQRAVDRLAEQVDQVKNGGPVAKGLPLLAELEHVHAVVTGKTPSVAATPTAAPSLASIADEMEPLSGDAELQDIFLEEAKDLLEQLDARLREWASTPQDGTFPSQIKRTLHTLKGGARLAGVQAVGTLSHTLETLLDGVTPEVLQAHAGVLPLAQRTADRLAEQVDQVKSGGPVAKALPLLAELEQVHALITGQAPPHPTISPAAEAISAPVPEPSHAAAAAEPQPAAKGSAPHQAPQEQVRVRADLLNRLISHAGEISIYQARLEQQNTNLKFNLEELTQTVTRLNEQLRQMTVETEAQIRFRKGDEKEEQEKQVVVEGHQKELDPLELDRFSTMQLLSRTLAETVNDLLSIRVILEEQQKEAETLLVQHSRISNDLQDGLLRTRMVPFSQLVPRLHRLVRQTADVVNKRAELVVVGAEGEMDRNILDRMVAPLEHIIRNAVGHGIEGPEQRSLANKNPIGKITITLAREGNEVLITVADDGGGLNLPAIRKRALERGLLKPGMHMEDNDVMQLILEPGFSTATQVTQISGRGVGTDVVVSEVKQLGGALEIASKFGQGTSFIIRLPFTLAITQAMLVHLGEDVFAVPHSTMEGVVRIGAEELIRCYNGEQKGFNYAGHTYSVRYLGTMLGISASHPTEGRRSFPHLLVRTGEHRVAIQVDQIIGHSQIVMKSVGPQLSSVRWISGGTILVDGRVALILDVSALVRMDVVQTAREVAVKTQVEKPIAVMVVDDSITVRKVTTRLLKRHNMDVITAKDGMDALAQLQEQQPDVMLLDVEMPRMDGYELARQMRNSPDVKIRRVPIIMITSRTGEKHREIGLSLGVKRYLGKPYQESDLLEHMYAVLAETEMEQ